MRGKAAGGLFDLRMEISGIHVPGCIDLFFGMRTTAWVPV